MKFDPKEMLALEPRALGASFDTPTKPEPSMNAGVAVIEVCGPLMYRAHPFFESYESLVAKVEAALSLSPSALVMRIDSPGGVVAGCFEAVKTIREMCAARNVRLLASVEGQATSAAYAIACAASKIYATETSAVGSIGVIDALIDQTAMNERMGLKVQLIASGARKTDGNPDEAISEAAIAASQKRVNILAQVFANLVAGARGVDAAAVLALEAAIFIGGEALELSLIDGVKTFSEVLSDALAPEVIEAEGQEIHDMKEAIEALKKIAAEGGDDCEMAKKMLAALDEKPVEEKAEDAPPPAPAAPADEEKPAEEAKALAAKALSEIAALRTESERTTLLASRGDLSDELRAVLAKASTPIEVVRDVVTTHPRAAIKNLAAAASAVGTRGDTQADSSVSRLSASEKHALDLRMGLIAEKPGVKSEGNKLTLGAMVAASK